MPNPNSARKWELPKFFLPLLLEKFWKREIIYRNELGLKLGKKVQLCIGLLLLLQLSPASMKCRAKAKQRKGTAMHQRAKKFKVIIFNGFIFWKWEQRLKLKFGNQSRKNTQNMWSACSNYFPKFKEYRWKRKTHYCLKALHLFTLTLTRIAESIFYEDLVYLSQLEFKNFKLNLLPFAMEVSSLKGLFQLSHQRERTRTSQRRQWMKTVKLKSQRAQINWKPICCFGMVWWHNFFNSLDQKVGSRSLQRWHQD